jgi:capsular exopolysaccharide synthesis family protein
MLLVGGVLGLALGLLGASLREAVDRRIRTPRDVARVTGVPVVGAIVSDRRIRTSPLAARAGSRGASAESFRGVRAHLDLLRERDGRRVFVLTAAARRQGTTTTAANVALAIANTGTSVVVVDADLRRPDLSALFGLQSSAGLSGLLAGRTELEAVLRGSGTPGLTVLPAGPGAVNAGELIATPRMRTVLAELARRFEVVIIDTPSIAVGSDAAVLGALTGSTLLIVAQGDTTRPRLDDALALLEAGGSEPLGIVLTRTRRPVAGRAPQVAPRPIRELAPVAAAPAAVPAPVVEPAPVAERAPVVEPVATPPAKPVSTAIAVRPTSEPAHLADPLPKPGGAPKPVPAQTGPRGPRTSGRRVTAPATSAAPKPSAEKPSAPPARSERTPRRVTQPVTSAPVEKTGPKPEAAPAAKPVVAPEPAAASTDQITEIDHTLGRARDLDSAFAALPIATAAEQRAGALPDLDGPEVVERPIVVKPDAPRPASRFAPDPTRFAQRLSGAYASAPAPKPGTEGKTPEPQITGTVVNTVSIKVQREVVEAATVPPPIRHILPRPGSTVPPKEVEAARPSPEPEPELVEVRPRTGPVPVPPLAREPMPIDAVEEDDDPTAETPPAADPAAETRAIPVVGSLLGEIGGLPRVEVRAARAAAVTDTAPNPERQARESYELRARDLERAAHERLMREQQRLAVSIREQLAHDKRELESVLDNRLEDTVLRPLDKR